jgi:hypothetical protein
LSYFFHPAAEAEHLECVAWFESKSAGLGASYLLEFESVMKTVCDAPHRRPIEKSPDIRRMRMKKFPFSVLYRDHADGVQVRLLPIFVAGRTIGLGGCRCVNEARWWPPSAIQDQQYRISNTG